MNMHKNKGTMSLIAFVTAFVLMIGPVAAHNVADLNHKSSAESHDGVAEARAPFCADVRVELCENIFAVSVTDDEAYASADVLVDDYRSDGDHYLEATLWSSDETDNSGSWLVSYRGAYSTLLQDRLHSWKYLATCSDVCTDDMFMTLAAETDIDFEATNYLQYFIQACSNLVCVGNDASYNIVDSAADSELVEVTLDRIEITDPSGLDVLQSGPDSGNTVQITTNQPNRVFTSSGGHPLFVKYNGATKVWTIHEYR